MRLCQLHLFAEKYGVFVVVVDTCLAHQMCIVALDSRIYIDKGNLFVFFFDIGMNSLFFVEDPIPTKN